MNDMRLRVAVIDSRCCLDALMAYTIAPCTS